MTTWKETMESGFQGGIRFSQEGDDVFVFPNGNGTYNVCDVDTFRETNLTPAQVDEKLAGLGIDPGRNVTGK